MTGPRPHNGRAPAPPAARQREAAARWFDRLAHRAGTVPLPSGFDREHFLRRMAVLAAGLRQHEGRDEA